MRGSSKIWKKTPEILESAKAQADANGACRESVRPRSCVFGIGIFSVQCSWDLWRPPKKAAKTMEGWKMMFYVFFFIKKRDFSYCFSLAVNSCMHGAR